MNIGELNRRIEVLEQRVDRDAYGGEEITWIPVGRVWAKIETTSGTEYLNAQQVQAENTTKITMRFYAGLTVMHRIRYLDKLYEITGIADNLTEHRMTIVTAKEMVSDGLQCKAKKSQDHGRGCRQDSENVEIHGGSGIGCDVEGC